MIKLEGDREIVISRTFGAPARMVFDAWTKPELVKRWWAPKSHGPPTRLVYTQVYEPMKDIGAVVVTVTFDEHDGKTHLVSRSLCPSKQVRDGMLGSDMEHGMRETFDQLLASRRG
jgi:uncharacterized protein YndB with AHSA1/START domain